MHVCFLWRNPLTVGTFPSRSTDFLCRNQPNDSIFRMANFSWRSCETYKSGVHFCMRPWAEGIKDFLYFDVRRRGFINQTVSWRNYFCRHKSFTQILSSGVPISRSTYSSLVVFFVCFLLLLTVIWKNNALVTLLVEVSLTGNMSSKSDVYRNWYSTLENFGPSNFWCQGQSRQFFRGTFWRNLKTVNW